MSDFLHALKADLLDRRLLPFVGLLTAALVGVLAYVMLGGGSSAERPPPLSVAQTGSGIALSAQTPVDKSAAETVSGSPRQRAGLSRNPFVPLAGTTTTTTTTTTRSSSAISTSTSKSTPSSSSGSSSEASPSAGGASPAPAAPKKTRPKRHKQYRVAILMGAASAGTLPQNANLTPYKKLKLHQQLPSPGLPLVAFTGVTKSGKSAVFKLVGEVILRGPAACLPSASQCEAIALKVGQTEELEYLPPGGTPVTYELQVTSIAVRPAHAGAHAAARRRARARSALASGFSAAHAHASERHRRRLSPRAARAGQPAPAP